MACVVYGSLVECVRDGGVVLEAVQDLREGDELNNPFGKAGVVHEVVQEWVKSPIFSLFGMQCAGPQLVLHDGTWSRVHTIVDESYLHDVALVGIVLEEPVAIRVDGVVCRGLDRDTLAIARMPSVTVLFDGVSFRRE